MALDLPEGVAQVLEEVRVEVAEVLVEWAVTALALALVVSAFALIAVPGCPINWEHLATI